MSSPPHMARPNMGLGLVCCKLWSGFFFLSRSYCSDRREGAVAHQQCSRKQMMRETWQKAAIHSNSVKTHLGPSRRLHFVNGAFSRPLITTCALFSRQALTTIAPWGRFRLDFFIYYCFGWGIWPRALPVQAGESSLEAFLLAVSSFRFSRDETL